MNSSLVTCPHCGEEFELSDVLTGRIREHLKEELEQDVLRREEELKKRSEDLTAQKKEIERSRETLDDQVEEGIKERLKDLEKKTAAKIEGKYSDQLKELLEELEEKDESIKEFRQQEKELRKKQRELEKKQEEAELEIERKLAEERKKIYEEASRKVSEDHHLKDLEKDKKIKDLMTDLDDMKRKAEQGSMETQGEVLEQDFEAQLRLFFPHDEIQPVPKGIRGADIIQSVKTPFGHDCGSLLWETKNTKSWSGTWIPKLKEDMITTRANISILVSVALPDNIARFGHMDGVWVSDPLSAVPLASALREQLVAVNREQTASVGKNDKMEALYQYLSGTEFTQKIQGIVEAFTSMQDQLNRERRAMEKHWNQREKQIQRVVKNTVGLYGDMQGIIGGQIPTIAALELDEQQVKQLPEG